MNPDWERCGKTTRHTYHTKHREFDGVGIGGSHFAARLFVTYEDDELSELELTIYQGFMREQKQKLEHKKGKNEMTALAYLVKWGNDNKVLWKEITR